MTLAYLIGPIVALIVFLILVTDKWEVVMDVEAEDRENIYHYYNYLQNHRIRAKIVRLPDNAKLQLLIMKQDLEEGMFLLEEDM